MLDDAKIAALTPIKRTRSVLALGWASLESAAAGRAEHRPIEELYPETLVRRTHFAAGGELGWSITALTTPRATPAAWKIVVVTGAPSWPEYWAPTMAALPAHREMVVVSRPGYGASEPPGGAVDIETQARALAPLLSAARGQRVMLIGQSYGAAIASLMAADHPQKVHSLVLLSSYLGDQGPTARWLMTVGARLAGVLPRDLRNAVNEVARQPEQIHLMAAALPRVRAPIHVIHGEEDDFAPLESARALARDTRARRPIRFVVAPGASHFLTETAADSLMSLIEQCVPVAPDPIAVLARLAGSALTSLQTIARIGEFTLRRRKTTAVQQPG